MLDGGVGPFQGLRWLSNLAVALDVGVERYCDAGTFVVHIEGFVILHIVLGSCNWTLSRFALVTEEGPFDAGSDDLWW
jgi:hypothetical protein